MKIILYLFHRQPNRFNIIIMPILLTFLMMVMYGVRVFYTQDTYYGFLLWNLFLAWLPVVFAFWAYRNYHSGYNTIGILAPALLWLLFFPNAPYLITDLIHMRSRAGIPTWYDAVLVFGYAFTGFMTGLVSLNLIHSILQQVLSSWLSWLMITLLMVMSSYGIYLGRVLRWNSWDRFLSPVPIINDVQDTLFTPASFAMTMLFSALMGITYPFLFYFARTAQKNNAS
ncbi:MAG: DUF1361 domain-containing protein [Chitinophagales bacterium]|nr:DUF1361 domain-containing protein [Chitinophagales bacterium]